MIPTERASVRLTPTDRLFQQIDESGGTNMAKKLLMGNEAFAHAALEAGVNVVAGYPGTPSSELVETVAKLHAAGAAQDVHVEWSTNEKAARIMAKPCSGVAGSSTGTFAKEPNRRVSCSVWEEMGPGSSATSSTQPPPVPT